MFPIGPEYAQARRAELLAEADEARRAAQARRSAGPRRRRPRLAFRARWDSAERQLAGS